MYRFIYFCFVTMTHEEGGNVPNRASFLLSFTVSLYLVSLSFLLSILSNRIPQSGDGRLFVLFFLPIFVLNGYLHSQYFGREDYYESVVNSYAHIKGGQRILCRAFAILLSIGGVATLIASGIWYSLYFDSF
ncbi:hypothetical protein GWO68_03905 [Pontibacter sp. BT213]|uniref:Uncharacterized protein n=1 Tax=Pontibacter fetidus TaxID=2700082 RepID=A0A6B2H355_9BACT|nr:hypothetical protein [Pontibacter fetidus]